MKFEKFLKQVGTHGEIIESSDSEKWLVCDGVGMIIPRGVDNILGRSIVNKDYATIVDVIHNIELDDPLTLEKAVLLDPTGTAKSIYRVFETDIGDTVGIINADYGLLEKSDKLGYLEVEAEKLATEDDPDSESHLIKFALVYDSNGNLQGYITGSEKF